MDVEVSDKFLIDSIHMIMAASVDSFLLFGPKKACLCESMCVCAYICMCMCNQENKSKENEGELGEKKVSLNSKAQEEEAWWGRSPISVSSTNGRWTHQTDEGVLLTLPILAHLWCVSGLVCKSHLCFTVYPCVYYQVALESLSHVEPSFWLGVCIACLIQLVSTLLL